MSTAYSAASVIIPAKGGGGKAGTLYGWRPDVNQLQDIDVQRDTTASRVNEAGLIEFVGVNVPRFDWGEGGGCPRLLVEPERMNLLTYSEQFDDASYTNTGGAITINQTAAISPDGTLTANELDEGTSTGRRALFKDVSSAANEPYTLSVFLKNQTMDFFRIVIGNPADTTDWEAAQINLTDNTVAQVAGAGSTFSDISVKTKIYNDGFLRFSITATNNSLTNLRIAYCTTDGTAISPTNSIGRPDYTGTGKTILVWGAQLEEGSYPTSYIKTEGSQVTRNADVISKTGISSLIGQSEGTLYTELKINRTGIDQNITLGDGTAANRLNLRFNFNNNYQLVIVQSSAVVFNETSAATFAQGQDIKVAAVYKSNGVTSLYANGSLVFTDTAGAISNLPNIYIGGVNSNLNLNSPLKAAVVYKTALTDQEAIALTTP